MQQIALAHDYLTQRGGAERVVEAMARAFPDAPVYTTLFDSQGTFPSISELDIRASALNRIRLLRRHHRLALPLLRPTVSRMVVDADLMLASSSGWAHGIRCTGRKVVYCHAPARWLYQQGRYLGGDYQLRNNPQKLRQASANLALAALGGGLRTWDQQAAASADRYLVNSTVIQRSVREIYDIGAEVLAPPPALMPEGAESPVRGIQPPYLLCVARLLPYKNVDVVIEAVRQTGVAELVVVGTGPERARLEDLADEGVGVHLLGHVTDAELRWLYRHCWALVAAAFEDYGLSPLEAAAAGRPTVALRDGGFLDTVAEGATGVFFDHPTSASLAEALQRLSDRTWDESVITAHASSFGEDRFIERLRAIAEEELAKT